MDWRVDFLPCKAKIRRHPDGWQGFLTQSGRKIRRQDMRGGDIKQALILSLGYLMEIVGLGCLVIADCHLDFIIACIIDPDEEISVCGVQGKCFVAVSYTHLTLPTTSRV